MRAEPPNHRIPSHRIPDRRVPDCRTWSVRTSGFSLLELLFAIALGATLTAIAVPLTTSAVDEIRTAGAARQLAASIAMARLEAVRRSTSMALRFVASGGDYVITTHADGNGNGVRTADILSGVDATLGPGGRLRDNYPNVRFGLQAGVADLDGTVGSSVGVRIGTSGILSLAPNGGATSGTLYLRGKRSQYAVRVLGATGRVRVFQYDRGARQWNSR